MTGTDDASLRRKKRRRQRRFVAIAGFLLFTTGMAWFFELQATTTVIVVRYADQNNNFALSSGLTDAGKRRSQELARVLGDVDVVAGIDAIFVAPLERARKTGLPLAMLNDAPVYSIEDPSNEEELVQRILTEFKGKIVLIITEPEFIAPVIEEMHGSKKLPDIQESEFDNLYIVSIPWFGKVKTLRLRYGVPFIAPLEAAE
jgi:2,3-bisphosphoglycerate-dependent phosphoglycerate mutase